MELSVATIVKNEEKNIRRMLESLEPLKKKMDIEIIIVDTGSNDNTISIAREYTDKIYEYKWTNDFAEMRNISLSYCTGEWILVLDADEELEDADGLAIALKSDMIKKYNTIQLNFKNYYDSNLDQYFEAYLARIFRNSKKFCYKGSVHEQPQVELPCVKLDIGVKHYGYLNDDCELMIYKYERNMKLLENEKAMRTEYIKYQISKSYNMANMLDKSIEVAREAYYKYDVDYRICIEYVKKLIRVGENKKIIEVMNKLKGKITTLDVYYYLGCAYYNLKQYDKAIREFNSYMEHYEDNHLYEIYSIECKDKVRMMLIDSLYNEEKYEAIEEIYNKIEEDTYIKSCKDKYIYSLIKCSRLRKVYEDKNIEDEDIEVIVGAITRYNYVEKESYKKVAKELIGINKRLDYALNIIFLQDKLQDEMIDIKLEKFFIWKGKIIKELVKYDYTNILVLIDLNENTISKYIDWLETDYYTIRNMYRCSRENICTLNSNKLKLVRVIEKKLLTLRCIDFNDYDNLIYRAAINSINYTLSKYDEVYIYNNIDSIEKYEAMWFKIRDLVRCINKKEYIEKLKRIVEDNKEYARMLKRFNLKDSTVISDEMIEEKNKILEKVEKLVVAGNIKEALEVLKELLIIFNYDEEVLMNIGVVYYIMGNIDEAMRYLIKAYFVDSDNVDIRYNLGCVLEAKGYKDRGEYLINNV